MMKALLIAPYSGLAETVKKIQQPDDIHMEMKIANLEEGVKVAQLAEKQGCELIISRGGTATMIEEAVSIPVVHIDITGYDMLRVFTLLRGIKKGIALVGFANISEGAATICNILEFDVNMITIKSRNEVRGHLEQLKQQGYSVVIGDVITVQVAEQVGLRGVLITSGREAIMDAIEEGKRIYKLFRKVNNQFYYLHETFNTLPFPIILLNDNNDIIEKNVKYELEIDNYEITNSPIISRLIKRILQDGVSQWAEIEDENNIYEIQSFLVSKPEAIVGIIIHALKTKTNDKTIKINSNSIHMPVIGESAHARRLRDNLNQYARADGSIYIVGEQGTGKRTVGQAIHFERYGPEAPFVIIDGKNLTTEASEIEELKIKLHTLPRGTILLKNVEMLPITKQQVILRLVNHRPVGIKIIALANQSLDEFVKQGRFDKELYENITHNPLHLPPLRERKEDIGAFVDYFLAEFHADKGNETLGMKPEAVEYMMQYDWFNNFSQLKQAVRELSMTSKGNYVELNEVKELLNNFNDGTTNITDGPRIQLEGTLKEIERRIINQVLQEEGNNQSKAAARLDINRSTLWRKLKQ
ncbi:PrpR N-terminal domain-containing protein [Virgibacillus sp. CBA3643]|uniref:PrpR N-terminal domain-containing protein n=1 Tax=Virgibacillus sp. CBA3643 TaxID=2942278 RepID=UPI0035A31D7D